MDACYALNFIATHATLNGLNDQKDKKNRTTNHAWLVAKLSSTKKCGMTFLGEEKHVTNYKCSYNDDKIWQMALTKIEKVLPEEIKMIKNNPPKPIKLNWNSKPVINFLDPEQFYEHYQELAPTWEEQEQ
ncbi:hypothetical protein G9A89_023836 [Geosiphon pyriformis]|nr:hypothetical protein G9A89_023836 [Geosiphon pyriformis]